MAQSTGPQHVRGDRPSDADYRAALDRLPETYATLLRLVDAGAVPDAISLQLGIEPEALEPLLDLAYRKLGRELTDL